MSVVSSLFGSFCGDVMEDVHDVSGNFVYDFDGLEG